MLGLMVSLQAVVGSKTPPMCMLDVSQLVSPNTIGSNGQHPSLVLNDMFPTGSTRPAIIKDQLVMLSTIQLILPSKTR
jgi:hypothetical protein